MSKPIIVFYAGLVYAELPTWVEFRLLQTTCNPELYNGGYVFNPNLTWDHSREWYHMDGTPVLLSDVPKELRAWQLVMS